MNKKYVITIMLLAVLVACSAPPASAWWYDNGLELSDSPNRSVLNDFSSLDNGSTVENFVVTNGSVYIPFEQGIDPEDYTYNFPVPPGVDMKYAGIYADVWSANYCGQMNFTFNANNLGELQFGTSGAGCGVATCDSNNNVAGNGLGGNGVWFNVTDIANAGATNTFVTDDVTDTSSCGSSFDGRKRGCSFIEIYSHSDIDDTLHIWFNQGMEDLDGEETWINVTIYNVTGSPTYWTLVQCIDCSDPGDDLLFNGNSLSGWNDGSDPDHWTSVDSFDVTSYVASGANYVNYSSSAGSLHPFWVMLIGHNEPLDPLGGKDLNVTGIDTLVERNNQTPFELVQGYTYTINATIKNIGNGDITTGFNVSLYNDSVFIDKKEVAGGLNGTDEITVSFDWTPGKVGSNTLTVIADPDNDVAGELLENNNVSSVTVNVVATGAKSDLELSSDDLEFLPKYDLHGVNGNNNTTIVVNITNINVSASGAYNLSIDIDSNPIYDIPMPSLYPKAWTKCEVEYDATPGITRTVAAETQNVANDYNSTNNQTSKDLRTINVTIKDTHEYGDKSDYTGPLSGGSTVTMFDVAKVVPENTTLYNALSSVAVVDTGDYEYKAYGIDGLEQDTFSFYYWYAFVNGIPVNDSAERADTYQLKKGDAAHWDILKYVNSGQEGAFFKPRPIMDYPEPFLHGFGDTVWNTTIVYPSTDASYLPVAQAIKTELDGHGVANVNIDTNASISSTDKQNNHLILLGPPDKNSIIEEVNANHTEVGMTVYFASGKMIDDNTDTELSAGANLLEACDNPFNNADVTDAWKDSSQTVWIASGVSDATAKESAEWLINQTCLLEDAYSLSDNSGGYGIAGNGFCQVQYKCLDADGVGAVGGAADALATFNRKYCTAWAADADGTGAVGGAADALQVFRRMGTCKSCS